MSYYRRVVLILGLVSALAVVATGEPQPDAVTPWLGPTIEIRGELPALRVGETIRLEVTGMASVDSIVLRGESRPGSVGARSIDASWDSSVGAFDWTPERAGLVRWVVSDSQGETLAVRDLAIAPAGVPASGVMVLLVAGGIVFGGAGLGLLSASELD